MRLLNLNVDRLPGINTPFSITAKDGVNLILGPNESGKSSLVRTVLHLLWPSDISSSPIVAEGQFSHQGKKIQVESNYDSDVVWKQEGKEFGGPLLPAGHVADCYRLGVLDLIRKGANTLDHDLALEIRRRMAGGYDLDGLGDIIHDPVSDFSRKQKIWRQKQQDLGAIILDQTGLSKDQNRLQELHSEAKRATQAKNRERLLQLAIQLEENRRTLMDLEITLNSYPAGMKNLRPDDAQTLVEYRSRLAEFQLQYKELQDVLDEKSNALAALDLPPESDKCNTGLVAEILKDCRPLRETLQELARAVAGAEARVTQEKNRIDPRVLESGNGKAPEPQELFRNLSQLYQGTMALEAALQERRKLAGETPLQNLALDSEDDLQKLKDAAKTIGKALDGYLEAGGNTIPSRGTFLWGCLALISAGAGYWVAFLHGSDNGPNYFIIGSSTMSFLAGGGLIMQWLQNRRQQLAKGLSLQKTCEETDHPLPAGWTAKQAHELAVTLDNRIARATVGLDAERILQKSQKESLVQSEQDLEQAEFTRQQLLQEQGLPVGLQQEDLLASISTLERYLNACNDWESYQGKHRECFQQIEEAENKARREFALGNIHISGNIAALTDANTQLEKKRQLRDALLQGQRDGQVQLAAAATNQKTQELQIQKLLERLELAGNPDPDFAVSRLVENHDQFFGVMASQETCTHDIKRLETELASGEDYLAHDQWQGKDIQKLESMLGKEKVLAAVADSLRDEIAAINANINKARNNRILEDARAAENESHDVLLGLFEKRSTAALARVLVQETESSFEQNSRPKLLEEASRLFGIFTHAHYTLRVTAGDGKNSKQVFQAVSNDMAGKYLGLGELSDGTRAQLLLAARLAFIKESESGTQPPIFLDESLTSSDPVRFAAIAGSLAQWAQESSRQIFYLTSNPADVAAWQTVLRDKKLDDPHFVDLGAIRAGSLAADPTSFQHPPVSGIPHPGQMPPAQYGETLQVPKLDPWAGEDAAPIYYLLKDELVLLHQFMLAGISSLGRWRNQPEQMVHAGFMNAEQQVQLEARGQILGAFIEAWMQGRGRHLDANTLKECKILSPKMLGPARELLENEQGNARGFMQGVNDGLVKRLHSSKKKELQNYLELHGFIDARPLMDSEQVINHVVQAVTSALATDTITLEELRTLVAQLGQAIGNQ